MASRSDRSQAPDTRLDDRLEAAVRVLDEVRIPLDLAGREERDDRRTAVAEYHIVSLWSEGIPSQTADPYAANRDPISDE